MRRKKWTKKDADKLQALTREIIAEDGGDHQIRQMAFDVERQVLKGGFEPGFTLLDGYAFETIQDRENALWAALWASQVRLAPHEIMPSYRPPMVVIEGPTGSGKSRLAAALSAVAGQAGCLDRLTVCELDVIAFEQRQIAWFDNVRALGKKLDEQLAHFISAESWSFRPLRSQRFQKEVLRCLTILTANGLELSPELERRTVRIRLKSPIVHSLDEDRSKFCDAVIEAFQSVDALPMAGLLAVAQRPDLRGLFDWPPGAAQKEWAKLCPRDRAWFGKLMQVYLNGWCFSGADERVRTFQRVRSATGTGYKVTLWNGVSVNWKEEMAQRIEEAEARILFAGGSLKPICAEPGARRKLVARKAIKKGKGVKKL